jgi:hypothetical protein
MTAPTMMPAPTTIRPIFFLDIAELTPLGDERPTSVRDAVIWVTARAGQKSRLGLPRCSNLDAEALHGSERRCWKDAIDCQSDCRLGTFRYGLLDDTIVMPSGPSLGVQET